MQIILSSGLSLAEIHSWDSRNEEMSQEQLQSYDCLILSGGHVPTQNRFFQKIHLAEKLKGYEGVIIGISAGTMNSAKIVYAQPELEGESEDPEYERFLTGLGLTELMICPHYNMVKDYLLDGKRLYEEITYPDSMGRCFYALEHGCYYMIKDGKEQLFGNAYEIKNGIKTMISGK